MRVRIRFFSLYSDVAEDLELDLEDNVCIDHIVEEMYRRYPMLKKLFVEVEPLILVNGSRVDKDYCLEGGGEIAFIPPASGG